MECKFHFFFFFVLSAVGAKIFLVNTKDKHDKNHKHNRHSMYGKHKTHDKHKKEEPKHADYQLRKTTSQKNDGWKDVEVHNDGWKNIEEHGDEYASSSNEFVKKPSKINKERSKGQKKVDKKAEKDMGDADDGWKSIEEFSKDAKEVGYKEEYGEEYASSKESLKEPSKMNKTEDKVEKDNNKKMNKTEDKVEKINNKKMKTENKVEKNNDKNTERDMDAIFIGPGLEGATEPVVLKWVSDLDCHVIGPSRERQSTPVVLNKPAMTRASCSVPDLPFENYRGYVGKMTERGPMLCGGHVEGEEDDEYLSDCFVIKKGEWVREKGMRRKRYDAAAVETTAGWWVTGGDNGEDQSLDSTEIWDGKTWKKHVKLPKPLESHCVVKINSTHFFITGGEYDHEEEDTYSVSSYIFNGKEFFQVSNLSMPRIDPACGLHEEHLVFVAGGSDEGNDGVDYDNLSTSEYFSLKTMKWSKGPSFDSTIESGKMLSLKNRTLLIGNQYVYQLEKNGKESWKWVKVGEFDERDLFDAFPVSSSDCGNWRKLQ